jgi:hypothetical protein
MKRLYVLLLFAATLYGQSFDGSLGGSQLYQSSGLQMNYNWNKFSGWVGAGYADGPQFGGLLSIQLNKQELVNIGDQRLSGVLDVDQFNTHSFTVRGLGFTKRSQDSSFQFFSGLLSQESLAPYLHSSGTRIFSNSMLNAAVYQKKWGDFRFHSLNLLGSKLTSIQSLGWKPSSAWLLAGAAGIGSGSPYFAGSGEYSGRRFHLRTSYTVTDHSFHRQEGLVNTEPLGFNLRADYSPARAVNLGFAHEKSLTYMFNYPTAIGEFNSAYASVTLKGFQLNANGSISNVSTATGQSATQTYSVSRRILPRWRAFASAVHLDMPMTNQTYYVATNEFRISSRLALRQNYIRMDGQNTNSLGVTWSSNPVSFSIDQQLYVSPIAAAFGGKTVFQAWTFNIRFRTLRGATATIDTSIAPDGRTKWGTYLSGLRYSAVAPVAQTPDFSRFVVRGVVVDESGQRIWGIAVQIGDDIVISGSDGEFFTHVKGTKQLPVTLIKDASLQPIAWTVKSAPLVVQGSLESSTPAAPLRIVLAINNTIAAK